MSHEIVKNIKIKENKVFIKSDSNNVFPKDYKYWECTPLSNLLKEKGLEEVQIAILKDYEGGTFQGNSNKYTRALKVLRYVFGEEYKRFNWRNHNAKWGTKEREEEENLRKSKEFEELLNKCLKYKFSQNKFIITKDNYGEKVYAKSCQTCTKWS